MMFSFFLTSLDDVGLWLARLHDAGLNILGIPWWVWLLGGIALAAIAVLVAPELFALLPEISEAVAEGAALDAEAAGAGDIYVIGHGADPLAYEGMEGYNVLNVPNWSLELNDAWINDAIDQNASFMLTSQGPEAMVGEYGESVYSRELQQLFDAGYTLEYNAAENIFMMVPP